MAKTVTGNSAIPNSFVIFLGNDESIALDTYITKNYDVISLKFQQLGLQFIYYPILQEYEFHIKEVFEYARWTTPALNSLGSDELNKLFDSLLTKVTPDRFYAGIVRKFRLRQPKTPCLVKSEPSEEFLQFDLTCEKEDQLDALFDKCYQHLQITRVITFNYESPEYDVERRFSDDAKAISAELKTKIEGIKGEKKYEVLAETVLLLITILKDEKPDIFGKIKPLLTNHSIHEEAVILSPIVVDKHYNIFLPAFGNMEIMMHPLSKAVYILFLRHLEGIRFKELFLHKSELISIYNQITSRDVKADILRSIDDLVDMRNPSINQKCSRIREAFRNLMDDRTAKSYYITGLNGEPKKISLPSELINFDQAT